MGHLLPLSSFSRSRLLSRTAPQGASSVLLQGTWHSEKSAERLEAAVKLLTEEPSRTAVLFDSWPCLLAARLAFAQKWENKETPSEEELLNKILSCAEMDRLTLELKDKE